jgi:protein-disulfide isomerase
MNNFSKKIAALIIAAVIIIVGGSLFLLVRYTAEKKATPSVEKFNIPDRNDYYFGTTTPKLTIVEFSDFACAYCRYSYTTVREIGLKYKNNVKIIHEDYPLHDESLDLAMAARCAGEQGLFWRMYDELFAMQGKFSTSSLPDLAVSIGANKASFKTCLAEKKYLTEIKNDYTDGQSLGLKGTPTFFFNGYKIEGEIPTDKFEEIIKQFLK